jgi:UDP-N-acetyl-D-mannosaminuronic acid dehydrogenase
VLPQLRRRVSEPLLAFCPERTIQGTALEELRVLPQIVGGLTEEAAQRAQALFGRLTPHVRVVSSLETAETIKLICNAHTDLIYGFGNQVALIAERLGLDADELITAANADYPRPDLSKPGFVGGSCLVKDPYLLTHSIQEHGLVAPMVMAARQLNESMPIAVAQRVLRHLCAQQANLSQVKVLLTGLAYKGQPETDDVRGSAVPAVLETLRGHEIQVVGHDFVVPPERISALGVAPVALEEGFAGADAVLVLNNHRKYLDMHLPDYLALMRRPGLLYDVWGIFQNQAERCCAGITYMRLGRG